MSILSRLRNLFRSDDVSREIEREMSFHLDERADDLIATGMAPADARSEARRRFGNVGVQRERTRSRDTIDWIDATTQDLKYALRTLRSAPTFTLVAVLSLALGIGANTAIFTIINAVMLKSLPVNHPEELVSITRGDRTGGPDADDLTNPLWEQVRDRQDVFSGTFAFNTEGVDLSNGGEARRADATIVSGGFFSTLGVRPAAGRLFTLGDDVRGCAATVVVSGGFADSELGGIDAAVGKILPVNGHPYRVVGVTDPAFSGIVVGQRNQLYIPLCTLPLLDSDDEVLANRSNWFLRVVGRPKPGMTPERIQTRFATLARGINEATVPENWPPSAATRFLNASYHTKPAAKGFSDLRASYSKALLIVMTIVGVVLLIACANVANLLLARAMVRSREIAVRLAIGAGRARLFRQLLTESLVLSLLGAALGVLFASAGSRLLVSLLARTDQTVALDLAIDMSVLLFTIAIAVGTALLSWHRASLEGRPRRSAVRNEGTEPQCNRRPLAANGRQSARRVAGRAVARSRRGSGTASRKLAKARGRRSWLSTRPRVARQRRSWAGERARSRAGGHVRPNHRAVARGPGCERRRYVADHTVEQGGVE